MIDHSAPDSRVALQRHLFSAEVVRSGLPGFLEGGFKSCGLCGLILSSGCALGTWLVLGALSFWGVAFWI